MKESDVVNKVTKAESSLNFLLNNYSNLLTEYKQEISFAAKIKQAVTIKKVDVTIMNVLETTTKILAYATLKNILSKNLAKYYNNLIQQKLNIYKNTRESVFSVRKSKILQKRKRAAGERKEAKFLKSAFISTKESATNKESITNIENVL